MKKPKARITVETTDGLKKLFNVKCAKVGVSNKDAIIELIYLWHKGKVKIPGEK